MALRSRSYSWPFELSLPDSLPPTLIPSSSEHAYVKYYTRIILDKPWSTSTTMPTYPLTIVPRVNLLHMLTTQGPVAFACHNRKKVELNGFLLHGGIVPGQYLSIQVDLQNPKQCQIKRIETTFIQHRQIASIRDRQIIFHSNLPGIHDFQQLSLKQNFDLAVPSVYLPPTYAFSSSDSNVSLNAFVYYELILAVKTNGILTDFQVSIPVTVGTESILNEHHRQQSSDNFGVSTNKASNFDTNDLPPSYETALRNELNEF